ncbi:CobD/CbiB family cobalamin biosynthesis protein [Desulfovibrio sp. 86]|uniref:Cobalamin biosynthesis protein CobD n=1 Tax=uncultured Desulfovibrio sp. TaxID=167968 RepID=A0A212L3P6_9BACT|nr:CobD/CbiB family cobalamin biosynthesis protein [Desulfovibrio sp. 86]SCM72204.1 Cobalamin biosynthesis protein CobD [uncultured Desulfovibrio sp.]VZH33362.1 Cobalamin biosynthesis protein CobD [Desulfovibrio sp. 86]
MSLPHGLALVFPWSVWECWWLAPVALVLDLWLGDPALPWRHPVCLVGKALDWLERPARRFMLAAGAGHERCRGRLAGALALLVLVACTGFAVWAAVSLPLVGLLAAAYLAWAGLAMGSLLQTGELVLERVEQAPEAEARQALSWLVSRDTSAMDCPLMRKTLADTLSENLTDAFTAPFFWLLMGGPVALWCYKAVSTTDSMWGYMTEKWRWLGWAGARADDGLAFVPARLAALSAALVHALFLLRQRLEAACCGGGRDGGRDGDESRGGTALWSRYCPGSWPGRWPGLAVVARQASGMPSPNSGWPMTACAWLCGARMAGPSVYFGQLVDKPWLGPPPDKGEPGASSAVWDAPRLLALCDLLRQSALYGGLVLWALALVCLFIF